MAEPMIFANLLHLSYNMWGDWENPKVKGKYWTARPYLRFDEKLWNDLLEANFLLRDGHVWIVDHEYAGMGDPFFDLGNLSINNALSDDLQVSAGEGVNEDVQLFADEELLKPLERWFFGHTS